MNAIKEILENVNYNESLALARVNKLIATKVKELEASGLLYSEIKSAEKRIRQLVMKDFKNFLIIKKRCKNGQENNDDNN